MVSEGDGENRSVPEFDARLRRPTPEDFDRMSRTQLKAYIRAIGFDNEVRDALAEYDRRPHLTRSDRGSDG